MNFYSMLDIVLPKDSDKSLSLVSHCPICFSLLYSRATTPEHGVSLVSGGLELWGEHFLFL